MRRTSLIGSGTESTDLELFDRRLDLLDAKHALEERLESVRLPRVEAVAAVVFMAGFLLGLSLGMDGAQFFFYMWLVAAIAGVGGAYVALLQGAQRKNAMELEQIDLELRALRGESQWGIMSEPKTRCRKDAGSTGA